MGSFEFASDRYFLPSVRRKQIIGGGGREVLKAIKVATSRRADSGRQGQIDKERSSTGSTNASPRTDPVLDKHSSSKIFAQYSNDNYEPCEQISGAVCAVNCSYTGVLSAECVSKTINLASEESERISESGFLTKWFKIRENCETLEMPWIANALVSPKST